MNRINPKEAPEGYVARKPKGFADTDKKISLCTGCDFWGKSCCVNPSCCASCREDGRHVIFVKKT